MEGTTGPVEGIAGDLPPLTNESGTAHLLSATITGQESPTLTS